MAAPAVDEATRIQDLKNFVAANKTKIVDAAKALGLQELGLSDYALVMNPLNYEFVPKNVAEAQGWFDPTTNKYKLQLTIQQAPQPSTVLLSSQFPFGFPTLDTPDPRVLVLNRNGGLVQQVIPLGNPVSSSQTITIEGYARGQESTYHGHHNVVGVMKVHERRYV